MPKPRLVCVVVGIVLYATSANASGFSHFVVESHIGGAKQTSTHKYSISDEEYSPFKIWNEKEIPIECSAVHNKGIVLVDCFTETRTQATARTQIEVVCSRHASKESSLYLFVGLVPVFGANNNMRFWCTKR